MYNYKAYIRSVYDGDTVRADVDLGLGIWNKGNSGKGAIFRLFGINAPEMRGDQKQQGKVSRDRLRELILEKEVVILTYKDSTGKYGRYLATIFLDEVNINEQLVSEGLAVFKEY